MEKRGQLHIQQPGQQLPSKTPEQIQESKRKINAKKKALKVSIHEGAAAKFAFGTGNSYVTPFALALNANPLHIGFISSFSGLLAPLAQLFGNKLMENKSRKKIVMKFVLIQSLLWIPIAFLSYLFWKGILSQYLPWALIILYTLVVIAGGIALPVWFSWMGDLVPEKGRGKYFAKRSRATTAVGLAAALIAAFLLDAFKTRGLALLGFSILFILAFTFRFLSFILFKKQYSPKFKLKKKSEFSFWAFIKRYDNFGKFAFYRATFMFASMIAAPFFAVYMLKDLQFSYVTFMIVTMSSSVFYLLFAPLAGKFSDRFGNVKLMYISGILFIFTPILWIIFNSPYTLIFGPQLLAGIANAALIIGATNFTYDSVSPQKRGTCLAYTNILIGIGTFIGAIIGGLMAKNLIIGTITPFFFVFGAASFFRLLSAVIFLPRIKEERPVEPIPDQHIDLQHPISTLHSEILWFKEVFR
jgi:MFS family permease